MLKQFKNKLRMFNATVQVVLTNQAVWTGNEGFADVVKDFDAKLKLIDDTKGAAGISTNGITEDKNTMHDDLIDCMMEIAGPLATMASRLGNNDVKSRTSFTDTGLDSMTEGELAKAGKELAKLAQGSLRPLAHYGVTPDEVTKLQTLAESFATKIAAPREVTAGRVAANDKLRLLFTETTTLLKEQMDSMVDKYRRTNPDFYNAYFNARVIVDYGIRHEKKNEPIK